MRDNRKKSKSYLLLFLLMLIGIGFAVITTNLNIIGNFTFTQNEWDVYFENIQVDEASVGQVSQPTLNSNNTTINYSIRFNTPGDYYSFSVDVVNDSTVDAMIGSLTKSTLTTNQSKYLNYSVTYYDGRAISQNDILDAGSRIKVKVAVTFRTDIENNDLPTQGDTLNLTFTTNVVVSTTSAKTSAATYLRNLAVTTGDGLYASEYENGRYVYRGSNPSNYIQFNGNELWRIISVEKDGTLKIINSTIDLTMPFDNSDRTGSSTYCRTIVGCHIWSKNSELIGSPSEISNYSTAGNTIITGTVTTDSTLKTYLNNTYYNSLSTKNYVVKGKFNVASLGGYSDTDSISTNLEQIKRYIWQGKVGLVDVVEYLYSATNIGDLTINSIFNISHTISFSELNTWLNYNNVGYWSLNPVVASDVNYPANHFVVGEYSYGENVVNLSYNVRPVVYLESNLSIISGNGTQSSPYTVIS